MNTSHHYVRTTLAGLFGTIATSLVMSSILVAWANRTLTDTTAYTETVAPLVKQEAVQTFVADKLTTQLETEPAEAGAAPVEQAAIRSAVAQVLGSPRVVALWRETNASQHAELMRQLDAGSAEAVLNFDPLVGAVVEELRGTQLAPLVKDFELKPGAMQVDVKGSMMERVRLYYRGLQAATWAIVLTTLVTALSQTLLHDLQVTCLVIGGVAVVAAIGTKAWEQRGASGSVKHKA